jgi:hypothetical protein
MHPIRSQRCTFTMPLRLGIEAAVPCLTRLLHYQQTPKPFLILIKISMAPSRFESTATPGWPFVTGLRERGGSGGECDGRGGAKAATPGRARRRFTNIVTGFAFPLPPGYER